MQAHHDDYSRPLAVRWLCRRHHKSLHDIPLAPERERKRLAREAAQRAAREERQRIGQQERDRRLHERQRERQREREQRRMERESFLRPTSRGVRNRPYEIMGPLGCHIWTGATTRRDYPVQRLGGKVLQVRRVVYEREKRPLEPGERVITSCGERLCVLGDHLHVKSG